MLTPKQRNEQRQLCTDVALLHARLMAVGLFKTGHKMHEVVREIGYEIAEQESV